MLLCGCRDKVHHLSLSAQDAVNSDSFGPLTAALPMEVRKKMGSFIAACYQVLPRCSMVVLCTCRHTSLQTKLPCSIKLLQVQALQDLSAICVCIMQLWVQTS